jgi:hypothetical protein
VMMLLAAFAALGAASGEYEGSSSIHVLELFWFQITHCRTPLRWRRVQFGGCVVNETPRDAPLR